MGFKTLNRNENTIIIAGLGNFGVEYEGTRHNCGFAVVDVLAEKLGIKLDKRRFKGVVGETKVEFGDGRTVRIVLLKPYTYMNNSGESIDEAIKWYKIKEKNLVVIYDDTDIDVGAIRIRANGSAGTHNGMKSVLQYTESDQFTRVRVGIGKRNPQMDMVAFVLGRFPAEECEIMKKSYKMAAEAALCAAEFGAEKAMNVFNGRKVND